MTQRYDNPTRESLDWVLSGFGVPQGEDYAAALVMLASVPAQGDIELICQATQLSMDTVERWKAAMIREGVWPGLVEWGTSGGDLMFLTDLLCVTGYLSRIVYPSGAVKYIHIRSQQ